MCRPCIVCTGNTAKGSRDDNSRCTVWENAQFIPDKAGETNGVQLHDELTDRSPTDACSGLITEDTLLRSNTNDANLGILIKGTGETAMRRYPGKLYGKGCLVIIRCTAFEIHEMGTMRMPLVGRIQVIPTRPSPAHPSADLEVMVQKNLTSFHSCFTPHALNVLNDWATKAGKDERAMR